RKLDRGRNSGLTHLSLNLTHKEHYSMPYSIELMSLGEDQYPLLAAAAKSLNAVQNEFHFRLTAKQLRKTGIAFQRKDYYSLDIWEFLREQRTVSGGNRPYII